MNKGSALNIGEIPNPRGVSNSSLSAPRETRPAQRAVGGKSFGALHQMLAGVPDEERPDVWDEIRSALEQFQTADGFVGPCELLVAVGTK